MTASHSTKKMNQQPAKSMTLFRHTKIASQLKVALVFSMLALSCANQNEENMATVKSAAAKNNLSVIELFTSEGCSSCPPADRLLGKLKEDANAIVLSYHVDYWDRLGWEDAFSQAAFTDRQRQYAHRFSLNEIYTPQAVVNGQKELVGSDEAKLRSVLQHSTIAALKATASRTANKTITVSYSLPTDTSLLLNIALVQLEATTVVKAGENGGHTLHHVNVVQTLQTVDAQGNGTMDIPIPPSLQQVPLSLVIFTQAKKYLAINSAVELPVPLRDNASASR